MDIYTESSASRVEDVEPDSPASFDDAVPAMSRAGAKGRAFVNHRWAFQKSLVEDVGPVTQNIIRVDAVVRVDLLRETGTWFHIADNAAVTSCIEGCIGLFDTTPDFVRVYELEVLGKGAVLLTESQCDRWSSDPWKLCQEGLGHSIRRWFLILLLPKETRRHTWEA